MHNEEKRNHPPRNHGPMKSVEKPKNFGEALSKLFKSLNGFKVLIITSLLLAGLSAILSLVSPNRLSDLTDEISNGLTINTENMEKLKNDLSTNLNEETFPELAKNMLNLNIDESTIYKVNTSNISSEDKMLFNDIIKNIDKNNIINSISILPESVLNILLEDSNYNNILITKEDKITLLKSLSSYNKESTDYSFINNIPSSINTILFPDSVIDNINITTEDKVQFISKMSTLKEDSSANDIYKVVETLPDSIQKLINPKMNMNKITKMAIILITIYIISALFNYLEGLFMVKVANNYARKLRNKISLKINKLPLKFFDHNLSGDILSRVTNDVDTIAQSLNQSLSTLVASITLFIGSIIMMFVTNYILAITAIVASLIGFVLMFMILNKSQKYFTKRQVELGNLNGYIEEIYSGLNVVKTCNGKDESTKEFDKLNKKLYDCNKKSQFLSGLMQPIMGFVGNFGYVAVCIVGTLLVSNDIISFGVIVAFIMYVRLFTNPLSQIAQSMTSLQTTAAASERVFAFLEEKEMTKENNLTEKLNKDKVKGKIEFKNVKFGYDEDKIIIKDFTATAKPGQKIAIVGPTGAGKTTMVNLLMKFYEINSGDIKIDGVSIKDLTRENIHDLFTMVLQDTWLFNGTVKENIVYNRKNISDKKVKEVCEVVGVDHFIKTLPNGYDSLITDTDSISAGQRQLLTIARGMINDAPFLILDEATSNVDTRTEELVQKAMDKLMENKTSFIIAHRLSTIRNADLILVMKDGNIIETGNHDKLMKENGFYASLYNSQFESLK
ncbi:MAG: ABC transporter ATP-binding protein [Bacilli bacterium]